MSRPIVRVVFLVFCLNLWGGWAGGSHPHRGEGLEPSTSENAAAEALFSGTPPAEESGRVSRVDFTGFFRYPLLITNEPADLQGRESCLAHADWQRFARVPAALLSDSRSLPLEI